MDPVQRTLDLTDRIRKLDEERAKLLAELQQMLIGGGQEVIRTSGDEFPIPPTAPLVPVEALSGNRTLPDRLTRLFQANPELEFTAPELTSLLVGADRASLNVALSRLAKDREPVIERVEGAKGVYRLVRANTSRRVKQKDYRR